MMIATLGPADLAAPPSAFGFCAGFCARPISRALLAMDAPELFSTWWRFLFGAPLLEPLYRSYFVLAVMSRTSPAHRTNTQCRIDSVARETYLKMKASIFLTATGAILAAAKPVAVQKRHVFTDLVYEYVTVTVTASDVPMFGPGAHSYPSTLSTSTSTTTTSTSTTPPPPPPPSSTPEPSPSPSSVQEIFVQASPSPSPAVDLSLQSAPQASPSPPAPSPTQQAPPPPATPTDYASTAVYQHNLHRFNHSAPDVSYSDTYASYAQITAQKCVFAHDL